MNDLNHRQRMPNTASTSSENLSIAAMNSINTYNLADATNLQAEEEEMDRKHLEKIIAALQFYRKYSYARVNKSESYLNSLSLNHQRLFLKYRKHLTDIRNCIDDNQSVINKMIRNRNNIFRPNPGDIMVSQQDVRDLNGQARNNLRHSDMENVQSTLKQFARDWSVECAEEREQSYKPIIEVIEEYYNPEEMNINEIKILVPGVGSGRLTYELACRGYECEGNEYSYFMLLASYFVLNKCSEENQYTIYPWVHQYVNNLQREDQTAPVRFPDVCPLKNPPKGKHCIIAGDFLEVYKTPDYDCVATCFFIDCANNIAEFIENIYRILVPGGIWVNLGPLLYHFSDIQGENSIEPTHADLVEILKAVGFEIKLSETGRKTKYAQNPRSMLKSEYESVFWVCQKPKLEIQSDLLVDDSTGYPSSNVNNIS